MKKHLSNLFATISKTNPIEIGNNLQETIAQNSNNKQQNIFSTTDLWNIQQKRKIAFKRRELMQVGF